MQLNKRPKNLNLFTLAPKMSITAKVSIIHRITGFLLFLSIPLVLYILQQSLISSSFYDILHEFFSLFIVKCIYLVLIFGFIYHMCAGIRFLFLDIHKGLDLCTSKNTARIVIITSLILTFILGYIIW